MPNFFQRVFDIGPRVDRLQEAQSALAQEHAYNFSQGLEIEHLKESISEVALAMEDINWEKISGWDDNEGFPLRTIQENSLRLQPLAIVNPTIKKAMNYRVGMVWGRGVVFDNAPQRMIDNVRNQQTTFSKTAQWQLEHQLATEGNVWAMKDKRTNEIEYIPIHQIGGWVSDPNSPTRVLYWLRSYTIKTKNFSTGIEKDEHVEVFYPAFDNTQTRTASIDGIRVDRNKEIVHVAANRQRNWVLGVPDLLAAMFWAKGHKELFEAGVSYVKAQGKFASKVISKTAAGAGKSAATLAAQPRRDENTGEVLDGSGTAIMSGGLDYQLMGKMSGGVNFSDFDPVAGLVAVGLGVPRDVLLGISSSEETTLEASVVDEANLRRDLWDAFFRAILGDKVNVKWPKIRTETEYRRLQALVLENDSLNSLSREEVRQLTLDGFGIEGDAKKVPPMEEHSKVVIANLIADHAAEIAKQTMEQQHEQALDVIAQTPVPNAGDSNTTSPDQGKSGAAGKLSTGKDEKAARSNSRDRDAK